MDRTGFDALLLDVVKRDDDFLLAYGGEAVRTPGGREVAHYDARLLEHMARESVLLGELSVTRLASLALYALEVDVLAQGRDPVVEAFEALIKGDPLIQRRFGCGEAPEPEPEVLLDLLADNGLVVSLFVGGVAALAKALNRFLLAGSESAVCFDLEGCAAFLRRVYEELTPARKAAVAYLSRRHASGLAAPLLLTGGQITPSEYACAVLSFHAPGTGGEAIPTPDLPFAVDGLAVDWEHPAAGFAAMRAGIAEVTDYALASDRAKAADATLADLIAEGESHRLEFKSTFRWNLKAGRNDPDVSHASLKSIAAFLNSAGGTLLIGVRDDGSIEGIETDRFPNADQFAVHFWNALEGSLGPTAVGLVRARFEAADGRTVAVVSCAQSPRPVFLENRNQGQEFYIRVGNRSLKLGLEKALHYIRHHFPAAALD